MNRKQRIPPKAQIALAAVAVLIVAAVAWFGLVHPKTSSAAKLSKRIDEAQQQLVQAQAAAAAAKHNKPVRVASLFRLVKAMPDAQDMSGILLQLNQVAQDSGITFDSIRPGTTAALGAYTAIPITLTFTGNYYDLSDFLLRLRTLVSVRHGELDATGRLFAVDSLTFSQGDGGFPNIAAALTVDAFVYGGGALAAPTGTAAPATDGSTAAASATTTTSTTSSTTSTTSTDSTGAAPADASATGVTP